MKKYLLPLLLMSMIFGCTTKKNKVVVHPVLQKVNMARLDSIIKTSDSSYVKSYKRNDFVSASFYINKKDSTVCQVMKDSTGMVRQVILARKDTRIYFAQYFQNGQLQAKLPLDEFGQYHGSAVYYYSNGIVEDSGTYIHGLKNGQWKTFDSSGVLVSTGAYDKNGQLIK
jgi:antitoxin component YwqK of YwqJK toxin-antitoxin module